ncbi:hypothetical protein EMIHUDRAFT_235808 [Emiliania huxleyi CCMP1516]|uniref:RanBP2-type domain-containing protein n=2 Tax=Emiliania huxleyi TaxID=2903 RepID=A0A0D3JVC3_EMIH1|nr:hypothetical protein EMIHUDRAFT_240893 [Emiliania huxleyi CCMP1516]XP_005779887.1 hypothetical protein EMIHUDRAFT_235808 [Emiliania huxleyi CCMP1516]EOD21801.1 hypothetical protein EMIHUDRAFT_240893 [Emiliania huxleyi CCMP1516]EOD27458.1 hypothetical protein EMIHUDRAFT_235808 [Emiliania huxleyi CCMP1516]|eukprot:XP_005774230.1 hypothetical protein EMIHUDRAFT_240893 [Emiliania huxleyi CCMP1516]
MAELSQADEAKLEKWVAAKRSKNFGLADQIRAELEAKGIRAEQGKGGGSGKGIGHPPNIDPSVGDWHCASCGNWNWARRKECNQCHAAKEGVMLVKGSATERRKRRATESARVKEENKAQKKKCPYCHRAACIC